MEAQVLSAYRIMWLFVFFDLPTETKRQKKDYTRFRKKLLKDGFQMHQYSVYTRFCGSRESANVHIKRVSSFVPPEGQVSILTITDKQFSNIKHFWGASTKPMPKPPQQLEMF